MRERCKIMRGKSVSGKPGCVRGALNMLNECVITKQKWQSANPTSPSGAVVWKVENRRVWKGTY